MDSLTPAAEADLFRRVWQRVAPDDSSLICTEAVTDLTTAAPPLPSSQSCAAPLPLTVSSPEVNDFLRARIECELKTARSCRALPCRNGGTAVLRDLHERCCKRARRLSASLLLLSGVWYLPEESCVPQTWPDYRSGLRGLFHRFQQDAQLYCAAAEGCQDALLRELFLELGGEDVTMRDQVRLLLEKS